MSTHTAYLASEFRLNQFLVYAAWGGLYNFSRYTTEASDSGEGWKLTKARKTLSLGIIAGFIVAATDGDMTPAGFDAAMVMAVPVANELWGAWGNIRGQIKRGEFPDWADDWFEQGVSPEPSGSGQTAADPESSGTSSLEETRDGENDHHREQEQSQEQSQEQERETASERVKVVAARLTRPAGEDPSIHDNE